MKILKTIYYWLKLVRSLLVFVKNPYITSAFFKVVDCIIKLGIYEKSVLKLKENPDIANVINNRITFKTPSVDELLKLPQGSVGYEYALHMQKHGLNQDYHKPFEGENEVSFVFSRSAMVHDLVHVATGYDTGLAGELTLQVFNIRQTLSPVAIIITASFIFRCLFKGPVETYEFMDAVANGWRIGKRAYPLFAVDWEKEFSTPLIDFRTKYNVLTAGDL